MFDPGWEDGCPSCSAGADEMSDGLLEHLPSRDTTFAYVSRAPLEKIEDYKARKGWTFPWYSSYGSEFNYDFHVTIDESVTPIEYNYKTLPEHEQAGTADCFEGDQPSEQPGMSCFLRDGDEVFHTYSSFGRGAEMTGGSYDFLDLTALGRQEEWEEPKGRSEAGARSAPRLRGLGRERRPRPRGRSRRGLSPAPGPPAPPPRSRARRRRCASGPARGRAGSPPRTRRRSRWCPPRSTSNAGTDADAVGVHDHRALGAAGGRHAAHAALEQRAAARLQVVLAGQAEHLVVVGQQVVEVLEGGTDPVHDLARPARPGRGCRRR